MPFDLGTFLGSNLGDAFAKIIGAFKVPPEQILEAKLEADKLQADLQGKLIDQITAQIEVNRQEAASSSMFVAGWRPFIGWICGFGLGYDFLFRPIANGIATALHASAVIFQPLDLSTLLPLLLGMLGLAAARSVEKIQGAAGSTNLQ